MATYAIGDVQGCWRTLQRLLDRVSPGSDDRLWFVGDLVNRGRGSLEALRWAVRQGDAITIVLGNHDVHLLACAAGVRKPKGKDTLEPILEAKDRGDLLAWLAARPLLVRATVNGADTVLVHAGLLPAWSVDQAALLAREAEGALAAERDATLERIAAKDGPVAWKDGLKTTDRLRLTFGALTRIRCCDQDGAMEHDFSGPPEEAPKGLRPWYDVPGRKSAGATVVFGHWAAAGLRLAPGVVATDSGCVWGRELTAVRLEDRAVFKEPAAPKDLP
jgi:bis(5'-nucleosyl)-tetraphosphatase (symmetrical)